MVATMTLPSLVGQESMKLALLLNAVNPAIGGVLLRGERGTAKSTAVRALARVLPPQRVVSGCRFGCDPDVPEGWCGECRCRLAAGDQLPSETRPMRVVELPVSATEDRVVGSLDLDAAVRRGERRFEPGLLAEAHRNILYVDEVNLLEDHLVDVLLDAAAMGRNTVAREGISIVHPARFILVGTMNPEEGELRPQLLDRFGLCVDIAGLRSVPDRVAVMELVHAGAGAERGDEEEALRRAMAAARPLVAETVLPEEIRHLVALICIDAGAAGHRADIVLGRTARTLRAWREALRAGDRQVAGEPLLVAPEDVIASAELALAHRRREPLTAEGGWSDVVQAARERLEKAQRVEQASSGEIRDDGPAAATLERSGEGPESGSRLDSSGPGTAEPPPLPAQTGFEGSLYTVRKIQLPRSRRSRKMTGKRSPSPSADRRGRYVASTCAEHPTDVALDATLRTAAPHQRRRREDSQPGEVAMAMQVEPQDIRQKVRRRRTGTFIVFVVDASASMDAEQRMQATKGAVLSLLRDAYIRRDKVSLVVFSGRTARVALQPTSSVDLAELRLRRLSVGGTTPLTHGLAAGLKLVRSERLRDPGVHPLLVLISDGRGNISLFGDEPLVEAQRMAARLADERIRVLVIDSARDHSRPAPLPRVAGRRVPAPPLRRSDAIPFNPCRDLAERAQGEYLGLYDLSQGAIVAGVARSLRQA